MELKRINDDVSVAPQISLDDMPAIKTAGFTTVINNRPDGESPGQPSSDEMQAAAEAAGLTYHFIPLGREGVSPQMVEQERDALEGSDGPVLAFCRSGTRSTTLWALAQAGKMPAQEIVAQAAHAGYEMSHLLGHLSQK
ncbi:MAG: TIGR01244 family sulfur transferase [Devosia sp.]